MIEQKSQPAGKSDSEHILLLILIVIMATSAMNNVAVETTFSKKKYTRSEVALHNQPGDLWIIIYGRVYNVTKWADEHPGDRYVLQNYGGEDASVSRLYNNYYICVYLK